MKSPNSCQPPIAPSRSLAGIHEPPAAAKGKIVRNMSLEHVADVEVRRTVVRHRIVGPLIGRGALHAAPARGILVVQHVGPGVVEVEHQPVAEPAGNLRLECMVARDALGRVSRDALELRIRTGARIVRREQILRNLIEVGNECQVRSVASDIRQLRPPCCCSLAAGPSDSRISGSARATCIGQSRRFARCRPAASLERSGRAR